MLLDIDYHSGVPIYRQIMLQVQRLILSGALPEGARLDSVRTLSEQLKVNPMTVSKAYSLLEASGFLERRRGVGLFVAALPEGRKRRQGAELLDRLFSRAAAAAAQIGLSPRQARDLLDKHWEQYRKQMENEHEGNH